MISVRFATVISPRMRSWASAAVNREDPLKQFGDIGRAELDSPRGQSRLHEALGRY
jgi:hypothetical protein